MICINKMQTELIVNGHELTSEDFTYTAPRVLGTGGKSVGVVNTQKKVLTLSTPLMTTWGLGDYEGNQKYEFSLQFPNEEYKITHSNCHYDWEPVIRYRLSYIH